MIKSRSENTNDFLINKLDNIPILINIKRNKTKQ